MHFSNLYGNGSFTFTATDGVHVSNVATVSLTVTPDPTLTAFDQWLSLPQDAWTEVTLTASDAQNDPLYYTITSYSYGGTLHGTAPNLVYLPWSGYVGYDSFSFTASDGSNVSNTATVSLNVTYSVVTADNQSLTIAEHRSRVCRCGKCQREFVAPIPQPVPQARLVGPRLTVLVAYRKGVCHCSFSTIRTFLKDVCGLALSRGQLRKLCGKVANSLGPAYDELLNLLPLQPRLNVDETGHKEYQQALWTWCFRSQLFTLFKIAPSRGSEVLVETLGLEISGVLGCDYFSAYRKCMRLNENALVQFCLAHLIRDVKFLAEHPQAQNRAYGQRLLTQLRELFAIIHRRNEYASEKAFRGALEDQGYELWTAAVSRTPKTREAQNRAARFHKHGAEYIRFITTPGVEPTNNLAEQAIRFVVRGPPCNPRHAQPSRPHLVRTHLDRHRHLRPTPPQRLPLLAPLSARPLRQHPAPLPALTAPQPQPA